MEGWGRELGISGQQALVVSAIFLWADLTEQTSVRRLEMPELGLEKESDLEFSFKQ